MRPQKATLLTLALLAALAAGQAFAQAGGLRLPERAEPGLDPTFARGWLTPEYDRFGFAAYQWRDTTGFSQAPRVSWAYSIGSRYDLGLSYNSREVYDERQVSLFGRWWFASDWALSGEAVSRDQPGWLPRVQDFRIGVQRRF
jgi:hypothetical protein